jgi:hypothetical protein
MQIYLIFGFAIEWLNYTLLEQTDVPKLYKVFIVEMALAVLINVILNFLWSYLITRQLCRVIFKGGEADKDFGGEDGGKEEGEGDQGLDETTRKERKAIEMKKMIDPEQP